MRKSKNRKKVYLQIIGILCLCFSLQGNAQNPGGAVTTFSVGSRTHIRALEVLNDSCVWFGANRGIWGFTNNGGRTWTIDSIKVEEVSPQFRSISVLNDSTALLLGIDSPAYMMKTINKGRSWKIVYKDNRHGIFFDCMVFTDKKRGFALGDPIDSCFQVITSADGGENWTALSCSPIPKAGAGEACFAASNSNLVQKGKHLWFVSGGKQSRVFYSKDGGKRFLAYATPLPQGETMSGIYSLDFFDEKRGVIAGGHYEKTDSSIVSLAVTNDRGKTWRAVKTDHAFFGSCVRFISKNSVIVTGHNGTFVIDLLSGTCREIKDNKGETLKFYTLRLTPDRSHVWMAGAQGKIVKVGIEPFLPRRR